jgi:hypothetical protein
MDDSVSCNPLSKLTEAERQEPLLIQFKSDGSVTVAAIDEMRRQRPCTHRRLKRILVSAQVAKGLPAEIELDYSHNVQQGMSGPIHWQEERVTVPVSTHERSDNKVLLDIGARRSTRGLAAHAVRGPDGLLTICPACFRHATEWIVTKLDPEEMAALPDGSPSKKSGLTFHQSPAPGGGGAVGGA